MKVAKFKARKKKKWKKIVADCRIAAFHAFYRAFENEPDHILRFVRALAASCQPVRDDALVLKWHRMRKKKGKKR